MSERAFSFSRREIVVSAAALAAASALPAPLRAADAPTGTAALLGAPAGPFDRSVVAGLARQLATKAFVPPATDMPDSLASLTYDQYRNINASRTSVIWKAENLPFQLQLFHRGFYYKERIDVAVVANGQSYPIPYSPNLFQFGHPLKENPPSGDLGFAGIRLLGRINSPDRFDEVAVFLGASYFRSLGRDQVYGLSARGLALKTGEPEGEEFPLFRAFWVETPVAESDSVIVHALLDSQSVTGAYRFSIRPGTATAMDVEATLFPRVDLPKVGLAPASSMFYFNANGRENIDDWRPEVHDSDGLLMQTGRGEALWRPLANPKNLQISAFVDAAPQGFGLMQRNRSERDYQDLVANYEKRPSLWVEPIGDWGKGNVTLVEIPSDSEIHDNIVAYWSPAAPIAKGSEYSFAYRLAWGDGPAEEGITRIDATRRGRATLKGDSPVRRFIVDYAAPGGNDPAIDPVAEVTASGGTISDVEVLPNPLIGGWRLFFLMDPGDERLIELRATLKREDGRPVETWLYRWTA